MKGKRYVIIHFWRTYGGFHKRIEMLIDVLRKKSTVERIKTPVAFVRFLMKRSQPEKSVYVLIYTSLMAPFILALRLLRPSLPIYYMVRGDEVTYVKYANRHFRAFVALLFQKLLLILRCHFIFVCEDLRVLFEKRFGNIKKASILPNTLGKPLPDTRPFDGRMALVGDFDSVKAIERAIKKLSSGKFEVHIYGNKTLPEKWQRSWLHVHGVVNDLSLCLRTDCSLVILPDSSAGFPNVIVEALEAGCGVIVHREFPFQYLPINDKWRFSLNSFDYNIHNSKAKGISELELLLERLLYEKRDFKRDNPALVELIESDWEKRVWEIFG